MRNLVALVVAALALSGCGGESEAEAEPETFNVFGEVELQQIGGDIGGGQCAGFDGYDDISGGAAVAVYDANSKRVGLGQLDVGNGGGLTSSCTFDFEVTDVPAGAGPYAVEVASRGQVPFSEDEATALMLTLGN